MDYLLDEARRFAGAYTIAAWDAESWQRKARALAHFMEHNIREGYAAERAREDAEKPGNKKRRDPSNDWAQYRQGAGT